MLSTLTPKSKIKNHALAYLTTLEGVLLLRLKAMFFKIGKFCTCTLRFDSVHYLFATFFDEDIELLRCERSFNVFSNRKKTGCYQHMYHNISLRSLLPTSRSECNRGVSSFKKAAFPFSFSPLVRY